LTNPDALGGRTWHRRARAALRERAAVLAARGGGAASARRLASSRFARQVGSTLLAQVLSLFLTMATAAIIARVLGPSGKGLISLATLVPAMLALFLSAGISVANVYFVGSGRLPIDRIARASTAFALAASAAGGGLVAAGALTGAFAAILPGVPLALVLVAQIMLPFQLLVLAWGTILQGQERIPLVNAGNLLRSVLLLAFTAAILVWPAQGHLTAVVATVVSTAAQAAWLGTILRRDGVPLQPRWDPEALRALLGFGLRGHVGSVLQFFNYRLDLFLVNHYLAAAAAGIYTISTRLAEILWHLPNAVGFVIFPRAASRAPEEMRRFTPRICAVTMALTLVGAGGLALLAGPAIRILFGAGFEGAYRPMLALLPGVVLLGGGKVLTNEISGRGFPHYNSWNSGISLVVTIVLCVALIPRHGILGAALASSAAYAVSFVVAVIFYRVTLARPSRTR